MRAIDELRAMLAGVRVNDEKREALHELLRRALADRATEAVAQHDPSTTPERVAAACAVAYARGFEAGVATVGCIARDAAYDHAQRLAATMLEIRHVAVDVHGSMFDACDQNAVVAVGVARAHAAIVAARKGR